ncbi:MAG: hypothetical protein NC177_12380 [Ruminococcus flavefaciens]|nr:hypothetical protein [Ruminococcus flavefaciens]
MSYEGEILVAPLIAGAAVAYGGVKLVEGVAKGVAATAVAVGNAVNSAVQTARVNSVNSDLNYITQGADRLNDVINEKMESARSECFKEYGHTVENLSSQCSKAPDMTAFLNGCRAALNQLNENMEKKRSVIENEYIGNIHREITIKSAEMKSDRNMTEESIRKIADNMEKREKLKDIALESLERAEQLLLSVSVRYENAPSANKAIAACNSMLEKAYELFENQNYEAALIGANSVMDSVSLRIAEFAENEIKCSQRYIDVMSLMESTSELMEKFRTAEYKAKKNGEEKTVRVNDFTVYYRDAYEEYAAMVSEIKESMNSENFRSYSPEELESLFLRISDIQSGFLAETSLATERLDMERRRKKVAKQFLKEYMKRGYEVIPLTDAEKAVSPLDSIILKLNNADSGEKISLKFNSVQQDGHIIMVIDIEDNTEYAGSLYDIESQREAERERNCNIIRKKSGENFMVKQRCKNPGVSRRQSQVNNQ